ncbi:hypothetical protein [Streptomyces sp. NPDC057002]|uniref:hypothetical protein n=1 Tax=Streptomyces sp. NPDC057002 TaxID=3345992 RepID=UPI003628FA75
MTSDFWLNKLRQTDGAPQAPAAPPAGLTPTGAPWWAHPTYTRPEQPPAAPQQPPEMLQRAYQTDRAQSARQTEHCPSCHSDHYWRPTPNTQATCFDCGWPVQNSTQGVAIANKDAPSRASLHEPKGAGYRPDLIVGRM